MSSKGIYNPVKDHSLAGKYGGEGGIRTLGTLARSTVFETAPIDHSGTSPSGSALFGALAGGNQGAPAPGCAVSSAPGSARLDADPARRSAGLAGRQAGPR